MKQDFSNEIAAQMKLNLESPEHLSIFAGKEKCSACDCAPCECDSHSAKDSKDSEKSTDSHSVKDSKDSEKSTDSHSADDAHNHFGTGAPKFDDSSKYSDSSEADDEAVLAFDQAIGSLLSASAALDAAGLEKSASLSLHLANFVVEAKKKAKKKKKSDSKKSDSKKSDSKKSDSKKSDSKKSTKK